MTKYIIEKKSLKKLSKFSKVSSLQIVEVDNKLNSV